MYTSFIRPVLKFVSVVSDGCSSSISDLLENIQLCAARIVTSLPILASRDCLYLETGSEPLSSRRSIAKLDTMYKVYNSNVQQYLKEAIPSKINNMSTNNFRYG